MTKLEVGRKMGEGEAFKEALVDSGLNAELIKVSGEDEILIRRRIAQGKLFNFSILPGNIISCRVRPENPPQDEKIKIDNTRLIFVTHNDEGQIDSIYELDCPGFQLEDLRRGEPAETDDLKKEICLTVVPIKENGKPYCGKVCLSGNNGDLRISEPLTIVKEKPAKNLTFFRKDKDNNSLYLYREQKDDDSEPNMQLIIAKKVIRDDKEQFEDIAVLDFGFLREEKQDNGKDIFKVGTIARAVEVGQGKVLLPFHVVSRGKTPYDYEFPYCVLNEKNEIEFMGKKVLLTPEDFPGYEQRIPGKNIIYSCDLEKIGEGDEREIELMVTVGDEEIIREEDKWKARFKIKDLLNPVNLYKPDDSYKYVIPATT